MKLGDAAIVIYEAWRTSSNAVAWEHLPRYRKDWASFFVVEHATKKTTKEVMHAKWMDSLKNEGWEYGECEDESLKTSPYILPYHLLPAEYTLFLSLVEALSPILSGLFTKYTGVKSGYRAVRYIGRSRFDDRVYDSGLEFLPGQIRAVPESLAREFLNHKDLFEEHVGEVPDDDTREVIDNSASLKEIALKRELERSLLIESIAMLDTKQALADFALSRFNQTVDKRLGIETIRNLVIDMVGYFGESL